MSVSLEQMEQDQTNRTRVEDSPEEFEAVSDVDEDGQVLVDLVDALSLLNKCLGFMQYLSDPDLCARILKKDRESAARVRDKVKEFLDEVEAQYQE